ncbi:MAG: hypothetical protein ABJ327_24555 [Litoreibacter sp.]
MENPEFILLGDSHAGAIGIAARKNNLQFLGGPLASGREFYLPFHDHVEGKISFRDDDMETLHRQLCSMLGVDNLLSINLPILCTIGSGFHVAATSALWGSFMNDQRSIDDGFFQSTLFQDMCAGLFDPARQFYKTLRDAGYNVQFALPPQRCPDTSDVRVMLAFQSCVLSQLRDLGCSIVDTRKITASNAQQRVEFCKENDPVHANDAFGEAVLKAAGYLD